ncbi:hypothetical protein ANO11243_070200 [Dothideomycetidae sp. 11243]|nr:hypothetical protein ANO11243_070200 [fungal sp. No.11243]
MDNELSFGDLPSSSQGPELASSKPRRPPTITPKRFTRFFTPRQSVIESRKSKHMSKAARSLRDITKNAINRKQRSPRQCLSKLSQDVDLENVTPQHKRRKLTPALESSPIQLLSSPSKYAPVDLGHIQLLHEDVMSTLEEDENDEADEELDRIPLRLPKPVRRLQGMHASHRLLERSFGGRSVLGRGRIHDPCLDWRHSTSRFYSSNNDTHPFTSNALPFCTTACNTNSLIAIGDEGGGIVLVDSAGAESIDFAQAHVSFRPHSNAVMDIAFSSDDYLMATASGDQTARVIDMRTQQTRYIMAGHVSSVKQIRFQPGNDSVLATSSRDGSVQIWDLRCRGTDVPAKELHIAEDDTDPSSWSERARKVVYAETCISIKDAHSSFSTLTTRKSNADIFSVRSDAALRRHDVSITAISFLPQGREHLLLSASAANASIKVWDIRGRYSSRKGPAVPVSATAEPDTHVKQRRFGLTSLALSTDGGRLYSLCRDSTLYAFSTSHLILGQAPEFDRPNYKWRPTGANPKDGLGPLYGLQHPSLQVTSFYIKAALRPARGASDELLAVGSRDGAPILFPTDEAQLRHHEESGNAYTEYDSESDDDDADDFFPRSPSRRPAPRPRRKPSLFTNTSSGIPIYEAGTPLVRGHDKEVTAVTWAHDGELISISDDFSARCWREDANEARRLRTCGEGEGERWRCGWADVGDDWDDDDG